MNSRELSADEQESLAKTLNNYFPNYGENIQWENASPLLAMLTPDRELAKKIKIEQQLLLESKNTFKNLPILCDRFVKKGLLQESKIENPYYYRLPIVLGEYPRHTKVINNAIKQFNTLIETYHKEYKQKSSSVINGDQLNEAFLKIVRKINQHGPYCFANSLTDLINMMHGYSVIDMNFEDQQKGLEINEKKEASPVTISETQKSEKIKRKKEKQRIKIISAKEKNIRGTEKPFIQQSKYSINKAGRLTAESSKLVVNGFGLKFGGHFDATSTRTPSLIQVGDFYAILWRQLSQKMKLPIEDSDEAVRLKALLLTTLKSLGMIVESTTGSSDPNEQFINPFSSQPQAFIKPSIVLGLIKDAVRQSKEFQKLKLSENNFLTLSDYVAQTIYRMQNNISEALGIGANDDFTVSLTNDARDYSYQFNQEELEWAKRFAQISLHRQGPAQAYMNAMNGVIHELLAAFIVEAKRMSQLQRSEYLQTIYNAIIDNAVTDFFEHPDFLENSKYTKNQKQFVFTKDDKEHTHISSYTEESPTGIFKSNGQTTPRFRHAGTIDVHPLPKDHPGVSEGSKSINSRNPLAAKQFQYAHSLQSGTRGDYVYNPIGPDGFIEDMFNGQLIQNSDGSFLPFIGVIPKNFDKVFAQPKELCASFVIRMLHSSRMLTNCPTFRLNYDRFKSNFLPKKNKIPDLPDLLFNSKPLQDLITELKASLDMSQESLSFEKSEKILTSLFKNIIYLLREPGMDDDAFCVFHYHLIKDPSFLRQTSRAHFEKIIRILKINAPNKNSDTNKKFMSKIAYLEKLVRAFYPKTNEKTAKKIKKIAKKYQKQLLLHKDIQEYFDILSENSQINLSRDQSPGMLYMKLEEDSSIEKPTLADKWAYYDRMHQKNFPAGYRDPEGSVLVYPTISDQFLDYLAKGVAKFSASMQHNENPIGQVISAPFIGAFNGVKNTYTNTESTVAKMITVPLGFAGGLIGGATEGGFKLLSYGLKIIFLPGVRAKDAVSLYTAKIDTSTPAGKASMLGVLFPALFGFIGGAGESVAKLLYDCTISPIDGLAGLLEDKPSKKGPELPVSEIGLYMQATPDNAPGFKIKINDRTRDVLLEQISRLSLIKKLRSIVNEIIVVAHHDLSLNDKQRETVAEQLVSEFILTKIEWLEFYYNYKSRGELGTLLNSNYVLINSQLVSAIYRCFLEGVNKITKRKMAKHVDEIYKLLPEQKSVLNKLIEYYISHPDEHESLIELFSEEGEIRSHLKRIDSYTHKLHDAVMQTFSIDKVKAALCKVYKLSADKLSEKQIKNLPEFVQKELEKPKELSAEQLKIQKNIEDAQMQINAAKEEISGLDQGDLNYQSDYNEINGEITQLNELIVRSQKQLKELHDMDLSIQDDKFNVYPSRENSAVLSIKNKEQLKWSTFATRELAHEFLPMNEVNLLFKLAEDMPALRKSKSLRSQLANFDKATKTLMKLTNKENVDEFYECYDTFINSIQPDKKDHYSINLLQILTDLVNVTMNRVLNRALDTLEEKSSETLLNQSQALGRWLEEVYQCKEDFRSLLTQQLILPGDQSFLHLAILRQVYIIHLLESAMKITGDERIVKTGLQKFLRLYYLDSHAVKQNGAPHYTAKPAEDFATYLKEYGIEKSPTFQYANLRVKEKLGFFSKNHSFQKMQLAADIEEKYTLTPGKYGCG